MAFKGIKAKKNWTGKITRKAFKLQPYWKPHTGTERDANLSLRSPELIAEWEKTKKEFWELDKIKKHYPDVPDEWFRREDREALPLEHYDQLYDKIARSQEITYQMRQRWYVRLREHYKEWALSRKPYYEVKKNRERRLRVLPYLQKGKQERQFNYLVKKIQKEQDDLGRQKNPLPTQQQVI